MTLLNVDNLTKNFGGLTAISHVDLEINNNELIGLIGPNGAGKTTLFNLLTGVYVPSEGSISFKPNDEVYELTGKNTSQIGQMGIARTFQNIRLFKDLSVLENVRIGMHTELGANVFQSFFRTKEYYRTENEMTARAMDLLKIFNIRRQSKIQS